VAIVENSDFYLRNLFPFVVMDTNSNLATLQSDREAIALGSRVMRVVRKHYMISSVYIVGILLALFATGLSVDPEALAKFDARMTEASNLTSTDMLQAMKGLKEAERTYQQSKGWFSCDPVCTENYEKVLALRANMETVRARRDSLQAEAKSTVGVWSSVGVSELRRAFWEAWEEGKEAARRMTMFDAIFIGVNAVSGSSASDRDNSFLLTVFQIGVQFLINLTVGLTASLFTFVIKSWLIITTYGPSLVSGASMFILCFISALSLVSTAIGGVVGGLVGGVYMTVRSAEKRARLGVNQTRDRLHLD
jgi:hypothetical protein